MSPDSLLVRWGLGTRLVASSSTPLFAMTTFPVMHNYILKDTTVSSAIYLAS